jgi:polyphosphate kinase
MTETVHGRFDPATQAALFLNRELSWLEFNARVLHEALDVRNPLLERLKFVAIFSSNLDEFYMVRVAGLRREVAAGGDKVRADGKTSAEQLAGVRARVAELLREQRNCLHGVILPELSKRGIRLLTMSDLTPEQWNRVDEFYENRVLPLLTTVPLGEGLSLPAAASRTFGIAVEYRDPADGRDRMTSVKIPGGLPRWVPTGEPHAFVPLEQVVGANLGLLLPGTEIRGWYAFRITRWADLAIDGGGATADLVSTVEEQVFGRRFAEVARVEVEDSMPQRVRDVLCASLHEDEDLDEEAPPLEPEDVIEGGPLLQLGDLMSLASLDCPDLRDPRFSARVPGELAGSRPVFDIIRERDVLVHHPFESFPASVERFLESAAADEQVEEIRLTVYRTSGGTAIVRALTEAARSGKRVTALVELQARFDEASNITWARTLEQAGVRVAHTVPGLKTHAKLALVVRREKEGLRRYVHIGTGNYSARTARVYTDLGLFTAREDVGADVSDLFDAMAGDAQRRTPRTLFVSPLNLRERVLGLIGREAEAARAGGEARIIAKMNALVDHGVIEALYQASGAGVEIDLVVRGTCALRPGVAGVSERIRVTSIVGRFLEHSRAWCFHNGGAPEYFIASADWMERNLDRRVEVAVPILDEGLRGKLRRLLETYLGDNRQAWLLEPDGTYQQRLPGAEEELAVQRVLIEHPWGTQ